MQRLYLLFFVIPQLIFTQNLVPNPGFEAFYYCPPYPGQILAAVAWDSPNNTTTDYFHRCSPTEKGASVPTNLFGSQLPHSGDGYAGIRAWIPRSENYPMYREYLAATLLETLQKDVKYEVSFWVSPGEVSSYFSDDIGIYFSDQPFIYQDLYRFEPAIRNAENELIENLDEWKQIRGFYTAKGNETYLLLGNFLNDATMTRIPFQNAEPTVYYYIDDVEVKKCAMPSLNNIIIDTFLCNNQPLQIGGRAGALSYLWNDGAAQSLKTIETIGNYVLVSDFGCYTTEETFQVTEIDCACTLKIPTLIYSQQEVIIKNNDRINDLNIWLFDALGRELKHLTAATLHQINDLNAAGLYFWQATFVCDNKKWNEQGKLIFLTF